MNHASITLLDGGMGQELVHRYDGEPTNLWSADVMNMAPELVVEVHRDFIDAGAEIITINAYSSTRCRLEPVGRGDDYERLQRLSIELAQEARGDRADVQIAGCLSPYGWSYRPEMAPGFDELVEHFAETVALQQGIDLMICETMGSATEGAAAAAAAATGEVPVWVAWSLDDDASGRLRSGETIDEAADALIEHGVLPEALLVNCSIPESTSAAMSALVAAGERLGLPIGAYANGFGAIADDYQAGATVEVLGRRDDLDPAGYLRWAQEWLDAGATIIGGCCEIGPAHIQTLANALGQPDSA